MDKKNVTTLKKLLTILFFASFLPACGNVKYVEKLNNDQAQQGLGKDKGGTTVVITDSDNDGLSDEKENEIGTNPFLADSDGDGLSDGEEVNTYGTDPLDTDTDNGGATDGEEVRRGTNPVNNPSDDSVNNSSDSDWDGLSDSEENQLGTDPRNPDTDGDGLNDGNEVNSIGTDPLNPDTDNGGASDGEEVRRGTNPVDNPSDDVYCVNTKKIVSWKDGQSTKNTINPFAGDLSAEDNYNYYSWSAHPTFGPQPEEKVLYIYIYQDTQGSTLFFHGGKDNSTNRGWEDVDLDINLVSTGSTPGLIVVDDRVDHEVVQIDNENFQARMSYKKNSDGGVIGYFNATDFKLSIDVLRTTHIDKVIVAGSGQLQTFNLSDSANEKMTVHIESEALKYCVK